MTQTSKGMHSLERKVAFLKIVNYWGNIVEALDSSGLCRQRWLLSVCLSCMFTWLAQIWLEWLKRIKYLINRTQSVILK